MNRPEIIVTGKDNGEGMVVHYRTSRGTDIFGLGIPNIYSNTDWDLGPTWCYLVLGRETILIDTGRQGNVEVLAKLLQTIGKKFADIDRIIITHSHEDHDGNLADISSETAAKVWAHEIYRQMITYHPQARDGARHPDLPGSCRMCYMPDMFRQHCLPYHQKRSTLQLDLAITDGMSTIGENLQFLFTPGHSPDSICIVLDNEVVFTGDTILPDITSHPSLAKLYSVNKLILPEKYRSQNQVYGLMNYIKSLSKLVALSSESLSAFPAHRLFYNGHYNLINNVARRAQEIIQFHIDRCLAIIEIIRNRTVSVKYIAAQHFSESQFQGIGRNMAINEVLAHLELMEECDDIHFINGDRDMVKRTDSMKHVDIIGAHLKSCQMQ